MVLGRPNSYDRKERRYQPNKNFLSAAIYFDGNRFDAEVVDESDSGMALRVLADVDFQTNRKVRVIFQRVTFWAVIKWVRTSDEETKIGIALVR